MNWHRFYALARSIVRRFPAMDEDVVQDAAEDALRHGLTIDEARHPRAFVRSLLFSALRKRKQAFARTAGREIPDWADGNAVYPATVLSPAMFARAIKRVSIGDMKVLSAWLQTDPSGKNGRRPGQGVSIRKRTRPPEDRPSREATIRALGVSGYRIDRALGRAVPALRAAVAEAILP